MRDALTYGVASVLMTIATQEAGPLIINTLESGGIAQESLYLQRTVLYPLFTIAGLLFSGYQRRIFGYQVLSGQYTFDEVDGNLVPQGDLVHVQERRLPLFHGFR